MIRTNAAALASEIGLAEITFENVAEKCPVDTSPSTVRRYYPTMGELMIAAAGDDFELVRQAQRMGLIEG